MSDYNKRLGEILFELANYAHGIGAASGYGVFVGGEPQEKAKQAITSLIKELVTEAKPGTWVDPEDTDDPEWQGYISGINEFEQNLLKALEEK